MNVLEATSNITLHMTQITAINDSIKVSKLLIDDHSFTEFIFCLIDIHNILRINIV